MTGRNAIKVAKASTFDERPVREGELNGEWAWLNAWHGAKPVPNFITKAGKKRQATVQQSYKADALVAALNSRDRRTGDHSRRVATYALVLARTLGMSEKDIARLWRGALLHDIGKIGIPDAILLKPQPLTPTERKKMQEHTRMGAEILHNLGFPAVVCDIVLYHQERYDGNGYPMGLKEDQIPLAARTVALADAFDSITSDRVYRKARPYWAARSEIKACRGKQFDPRIVDAFLSIPEKVWQQAM